jgi:hypothetical protein
MKVFCNICKRNVPCNNGTHPQQFLRRHQGQCKKLLNQTRSVVLNTPPSKKTQVRSLLINEYGESFRPTFGHNDWICEAYNDEDLSDVDINSVMETLIVQTAEDCGFLDRADVLMETAHGSGSDIVYSLIQMIKYEEKLRGFDINRLCSSSAVKDIQLKLQELLMEDEMPDKKLIRFRNMHNKTVDWTDLIQLYDFGLSVGLSDAAGNRLLSVMNEILAKHGSNILLRKSWRHIRMAIDKQKTSKLKRTTDIRVPLPPTFGEKHYLTMRPLRAFHGTAEDVQVVVADMLLSIDPSKLVLEYQPTMNGEEVAPPNEQLLGEFTTGRLFQQFSDDAKKYGESEGMRVVPLCFGIWADETTTSASRNMSELPVYIALLNAGTQSLAFCSIIELLNSYVLKNVPLCSL